MNTQPTLLEIDLFEDIQSKKRLEMLDIDAKKLEEKKILEAQLAREKRVEDIKFFTKRGLSQNQ